MEKNWNLWLSHPSECSAFSVSSHSRQIWAGFCDHELYSESINKIRASPNPEGHSIFPFQQAVESRGVKDGSLLGSRTVQLGQGLLNSWRQKALLYMKSLLKASSHGVHRLGRQTLLKLFKYFSCLTLAQWLCWGKWHFSLEIHPG